MYFRIADHAATLASRDAGWMLAVLDTWGEHLPSCMTRARTLGLPCDCGLAATRRALESRGGTRSIRPEATGG